MQTEFNQSSIAQGFRKNNIKYEKFLHDVYVCLQEKQYEVKRSHTPDIPDQFPKFLQKEQILGLSTIQQLPNEKRLGKKSVTNKSNKFKNFISSLDEHQKKLSHQNMNLLGLEVKKISYCQKIKKSVNQDINTIDENTIDLEGMKDEGQKRFSQTQTHLVRSRKTYNCFSTTQEDLKCRKAGISHREILGHRKIISATQKRKSSSFRTREKQKNVKVQMKKKIMAQNQNPVYDSRMNTYKQLLFKLNYAHGLYVEMEKDFLIEDFTLKNQMKYKCWVGNGNNGNLIKILLKRRFWWVIVEEKNQKVNFLWTQLKSNEYFAKQMPCEIWKNDENKAWGRRLGRHSISMEKHNRIKPAKKEEKTRDQQYNYKIFTHDEIQRYKQFYQQWGHKSYQEKKQILELTQYNNEGVKMHNHLTNNFYLGNKKALFYNLKEYYDLLGKNVFTKIPLTFHIKKGFADMQYKRFVAYYKKRELVIKKQEKQEEKSNKKISSKNKMRNVWIVKPGQLTNRGHGITVIDQIYQLNSIMKRQNQHQNGTQKTFIVQLYIDRPLLYQKRKFDIRQYMLITHIHGLMRAYWFKEGYLRTSSYEFDIEDFDREIHLTNDAIQKYAPGYGKYEQGNKLSFAQFQRYLDSTYPKKKYNFASQIIPQMKSICIDSVKSSYLKLSPQRLQHNFQIFGMDFMIDQSFKPWLIQINTNPCLQLCCPLVSRLIPQMLEQALRLSLDVVFPPPCQYPNTAKHLAPDSSLQSLEFELIFDEKRDGQEIRKLYTNANSNLLLEIGQISEDETYQDEEKTIPEDQILIPTADKLLI